MDRIIIRGIRAHGRHGALPGERDAPQPFDIDAVLFVDLQTAADSDCLEDTVDYAAVHRRIVTIVEERSYELLERLAGEISADIFSDLRVVRAQVSISKPRLLDGATPIVELVRDNPRRDPDRG